MSREDLAREGIEDAVLVVAHPDDEILWFGSVAGDVGKIIICFIDDPSTPELAEARRRTLADHPLADRIHCLELRETSSFGHADWDNPKLSRFGLEIAGPSGVSREYRERAAALKVALAPLVANVSTLFTHNPWGEYGHEEHIMVHRVVSELAAECDASVWCNNYVSSWSVRLMYRYLSREGCAYFRKEVDTDSMRHMSMVYRQNDTWTWFDDYAWFNTEYYMRGPFEYRAEAGFGWIFPLNFIEIPDRSVRKPVPLRTRLRRKLRRLIAGNAQRKRN